ncbi:hypothetical protein [Cobetia sp. 5-11-6-3]|uniref:hypothetical protein n=1 Tax=Cobetia sp. 5-11-6-3 TaxID=2737458 RepID=UPI0015968EF7|nr:hypothetical protein [Cobetia sp. 5-11-6-3]
MSNSNSQVLNRSTVFVPGAFPLYSYVHRKFVNERSGFEVDPEVKINSVLSQSGIIVQVVGPSKSGKTRAIEKCVGENNLVLVSGSQISKETDLWSIVSSKLRQPVTTSFTYSNSRNYEEGDTLKGKLNGAVVSSEYTTGFKKERAQQFEETSSFNTSPFNKCLELLSSDDKVLFLDDFHVIPYEIQPRIAAQLKTAAEAGVKICLAEVPHHSNKPISALPDLTGRIHTVKFKYWSEKDLVKIGRLGFDKLHVSINEASLRAFAIEAAGSPQLMQMICLNAAEFAEINEPLQTHTNKVFSLEDIRVILLNTHESIDRSEILKILDQGPDERGKSRTQYSVHELKLADNYEIVLAAISLSPPAGTLTWSSGTDNLQKRIDLICLSNKKPQKAQITRTLEHMQVLANTSMPSLPIIDWNASSELNILDPYFLFHLRWSEKYEKIRGRVQSL